MNSGKQNKDGEQREMPPASAATAGVMQARKATKLWGTSKRTTRTAGKYRKSAPTRSSRKEGAVCRRRSRPVGSETVRR